MGQSASPRQPPFERRRTTTGYEIVNLNADRSVRRAGASVHLVQTADEPNVRSGVAEAPRVQMVSMLLGGRTNGHN